MKHIPILFLLLLAVALPAHARERDCAPRIVEGWIRLLPGGMPHAGFGRIENPCPMPVTILGASSPAYDSVELHESRVVDGVNRMRAVPQLPIAPQGSAVLKPGGLHLMLMDPHAPLHEGSRVEIEFKLADGRALRGEFTAHSPLP